MIDVQVTLDPGGRRFRAISSTVAVELVDDDLLGVDPRVRSARLLFEPAARRPAIVRSRANPSSIGSGTRLSPTESKDSLSSHLYTYTDINRSSDSLEGGRTYFLQVFVEEDTTGTEDPEVLARTYTGFTLDSLKRILHVCVEPGRGGTGGAPDPLLPQLWHLDNTGQDGYAETGGVAGEDLQMDGILEEGPTGDGIRVAVVDSGMETCHPDLRDNVEQGASFHFDAFDASTDPAFAWGLRMDASDPFNFDSTGGHGSSRPALLTVDQMGTERGRGVLRDSNPLDGESTVNPYGDYTGRMNGTSASAALVSGGVALLLESKPGLTWRDVRHILAKTARRIDPDIESVAEMIGTVTRTLRLPWTGNAAGYSYHDWYGFGALDLDAAIELATDYVPASLGAFRQSGWFESGVAGSIPDNDGTGIARTLSVSTLAGDASIEAVQIEVDIDHEFPNDLGIHLVSPHGTRAVINQVFNETLALDDPGDLRWRVLSNAFYGETPNGDWQIEVFDAAEDDTGSLEAWRLRFYYGSHPEQTED